MQVAVRNEVAIPIGPQAIPATFYSFDGLPPGQEHFLVDLGARRRDDEAPLVRIHSECITGDLFGSQRCDCGPQLQEAIERLQSEGGYLVYLRQEGRGIGLYAKLDAYVLQDQGLDTYEANVRLNYPEDPRVYRPAAQMLEAVGVRRVRLLTNNPRKVQDVQAGGLEVTEIVPTGVFVNSVNSRYIATKIARASHTMSLSNVRHNGRNQEART
jgi:GTP cyclohydrolase II